VTPTPAEAIRQRKARVVAKFLDAAVRQGRGAKRTIAQQVRQGNPLRVTSVRALGYPPERQEDFALTLTKDCADWPIIVVIDHPNDPVVEALTSPRAERRGGSQVRRQAR
jgi:hypothetical protein